MENDRSSVLYWRGEARAGGAVRPVGARGLRRLGGDGGLDQSARGPGGGILIGLNLKRLFWVATAKRC